MIRVYANRKGAHCRLLVTGHAQGDAEQGVICAGVSALAGALALHAATFPHARYHMAPGEVFVSCRGLGDCFELIIKGLQAIAAAYPDQVKIEPYMSVNDKIKTV